MSDCELRGRSAVANLHRPCVLRHPKVFGQLCPVYKWEFTRRHPYYLRFWKWANQYWQYRRDEIDIVHWNMFDRHDLFGSVQVMVFITAIFNYYPDPAIDARLDKSFSSPFSDVKARPETYRGLANYLLTFLPAQVQRAVAYVYLREMTKETFSKDALALIRSVAGPVQNREQAIYELALSAIAGNEPLHDRLLQGLFGLNAPSLDEECPGVLYVDYNAPLKDAMTAVKRVVQDWKAKHGAPDVRRRKDKWDQYLRVWDAREGWTNGVYDGASAKRLRDIAVESHLDLPTVQSQYEAAFKLIVGRDYEPMLWLVVFGGLKVTKAKYDSWRRSKHRPDADAMSKSIPASSMAGAATDATHGGHISAMTSNDEANYRDLVADIRALVEKGRPDDEIIAELELSMTTEEFRVVRIRIEGL